MCLGFVVHTRWIPWSKCDGWIERMKEEKGMWVIEICPGRCCSLDTVVFVHSLSRYRVEPGIIDLVSLKRVRSRFNAWNLCAPYAARLFEILNFFFFENFCVANGSDVSVKCYSNSVSERFSFFLCQVELHERVDFSNIFHFEKKFRNH